ncbi:hypothetical protein A3F66_01885 [candidate division TM6 bacterium RIFCSPHIGHO2_12_FULL_32_22]|nr:MAG: hypothetical protein A3F66_01885 [candidate division TM6 bacterium RIFCSPHIGHO2_12_FULL_32_22]
MFKRNIKEDLKKALNRAPVVLLNGARQVGKSTLALEFQKEGDFEYITFDDEMVYLSAKNDPQAFIKSIKKPVIIDEVQRVPEIFLPIKIDVDNNRHAGRYLLTGSANPLLIPRLGDSLAGRMEILDLMPLSQGEIEGVKENFTDTVFEEKELTSAAKGLTKKELYEKAIIGGYPSVQKISKEDRDAWMRSYLNLILQRDIKDLAQIEKLTELPNILKILAYQAANLLNVAEVSRDVKMVSQTVHRYIALLETIFLINLEHSWHTNLTLRITKAPKVYLVDSGLLTYLLGLDLNGALNDTLQMGKVIENFVVNELRKQITWSKVKPELYHFRSTSGQEVDIILQDRSGKLIAIEVKSGETVLPKDFNNLKYLQEKLGKKFIKGFVVYSGRQILPFGKDLATLPINLLWKNFK